MMATLEIPIPPIANTTGSVRFRVRLEGVDYLLTLQWNQRQGTWSLDVSDVDEVAIVSGVALVPFWSLLELVTDTRKPPGTLMLWRPDGADQLPTLTDLGQSSRLLYYEAA